MSNSSSYFREIEKYPLLPKEEQSKLINEYYKTRCNKIRTKLINHNLRLVIHLAMKMKIRRNDPQFIDLVQEGNVGLMKALDRFDPSLNTAFGTYAVYWIRCHLFKHVLNNFGNLNIKQNHWCEKIFYNLAKIQEKFEKSGIKATDELLAEELNVSVRQLSWVRNTMKVGGWGSFDDENSTYINEVSAQSETESMEERIFKRETDEKLKEVLGKFPLEPVEKLIIERRFLQEEPKFLWEIAEEANLSKQRIYQIECNLMAKLKKNKEISKLGR